MVVDDSQVFKDNEIQTDELQKKVGLVGIGHGAYNEFQPEIERPVDVDGFRPPLMTSTQLLTSTTLVTKG